MSWNKSSNYNNMYGATVKKKCIFIYSHFVSFCYSYVFEISGVLIFCSNSAAWDVRVSFDLERSECSAPYYILDSIPAGLSFPF